MANNQNQLLGVGKIGIIVERGESIDRAIRRFKKKIDSSKILREYRDRQEYVKPSERKKKKMARAKRREKERQMMTILD